MPSKIRQGEVGKRGGSGGTELWRRQQSPLADAYWIRGLFWENQGDTESALADYNQAIANGLRNGDVYLRLGGCKPSAA